MFEVLNAHGESAARWDMYINALPYDLRDIHLTAAWGRAHEKPGHAAMLAVNFEEERGYITCQAFMLRETPDGTGLYDITSIGYGGPVTSCAIPSWTDGAAFERQFAEWRTKTGVVSEFYLINPVMASEQAVLLPTGEPLHLEKGVTILHVGSPEEIAAQLRPNRKQSLAKGKDAVILPVIAGWFAGLYDAAMEAKDAAPRWRLPIEYFDGLDRELENNFTILSAAASSHERPAAAAVFLTKGSTAYYHLAARTADAPDGYADQVLLAGLALARERGCVWMHLGGGLTADPDDTLAAYKHSWGGMIRPVYSVRRIYNEGAYQYLSNGRQTTFFPAYREGEA